MIDVVIRIVEGYGYLPIVRVDDAEIYRGEFHRTTIAALTKALEWMTKSLKGQKDNPPAVYTGRCAHGNMVHECEECEKERVK